MLNAIGKNVYIVKRMGATEYPNLHATSDFKDFRSLTVLSPEKNYNWYESELIHWKLLDGKDAERIVYKPQNFNPERKYPVIFFHYERNSNGLNVFIHPVLSDGRLNIAWFVSNGYVVVIPNIYYKIGDPGKGVYNSVVSCAEFMGRKPWVDIHHFGLQGHSFGGWETNYLITHCSLFAAAVSASGASDFIRIYENRLPAGEYLETGQGRIGTTLWKDPQAYFNNSPIFLANKVTTPVLIMHTKGDYTINGYEQGIQWYNALVRLGKKTWMLTYGGGEDHVLNEESNRLDFTIRMGQFFDYYLKGSVPPRWMTEGGISLELDTTGRRP